MKLLSVNVSLPRPVDYQGRTVETGIFKSPVSGRVPVRRLNLDGDGQADLTGHGGVNRAVYAYPYEHYGHWAVELGRDDFSYGQFGENLTVEGLTEETVYIGDVIRIGTARLEVSQPRPPCFKLGLRMGQPTFPKAFLASGRVGFYLRVLEEGEIGAGDDIFREALGVGRMTVREISHLLHFDKGNREAAARAAELPALSQPWRESFAGLAGKPSTTSGL